MPSSTRLLLLPLIAGLTLVSLPEDAQAQAADTLHACYVPATGTVYVEQYGEVVVATLPPSMLPPKVRHFDTPTPDGAGTWGARVYPDGTLRFFGRSGPYNGYFLLSGIVFTTAN